MSCGSSKICFISIFIPIIETKIQINTEPNLLAPTPSRFLALVNDNIKPKEVLNTTSQKKELLSVEFCKYFIEPKKLDNV
ncbi:MAG: Uncharacterised protein [Bacteroidetes bacterium MED-G17]|nr:MAG: Uncharacterised protein [Bacteroidetes bacterium MED-G17]